MDAHHLLNLSEAAPPSVFKDAITYTRIRTRKKLYPQFPQVPDSAARAQCQSAGRARRCFTTGSKWDGVSESNGQCRRWAR